MIIRRYSSDQWIWQRTLTSETAVQSKVSEILETIRRDGDFALRRYTQEFDRWQGAMNAEEPLSVPRSVREAALAATPASLQTALREAAQRIRRFHEDVLPDNRQFEQAGATLGMVWRPLRRVGVYAPGGKAAYPSTVFMNTIPAQVAGVTEIVLASPPQAETGWPHPLILAAAEIAGVQEVYRIGGAQAIAAFAYGTASVPAVEKIVGPGNQWVATAKQQVQSHVAIDSIAGPSEVFVIADHTAKAPYVAADMLAQAEHDEAAGAVCISTDHRLLDEVASELERQLAILPRRSIAAQALQTWGALVEVASMTEAIELTNQMAPEHVELHVAHPYEILPELRTVGAVFLGEYTPEPVGDYLAGPNHVLPTHGTARFASGLSVHDFLRRFTYVSYDSTALARDAESIIRLAEAEGLDGHARAVQIRLEGERS